MVLDFGSVPYRCSNKAVFLQSAHTWLGVRITWRCLPKASGNNEAGPIDQISTNAGILFADVVQNSHPMQDARQDFGDFGNFQSGPMYFKNKILQCKIILLNKDEGF